MDSVAAPARIELSIGSGEWCEQHRRAATGLFALVNSTAPTIPLQLRPQLERGAINLFALRTRNEEALAVAPRLLPLAGDSNQRLIGAVAGQDPECPWAVLIASRLPTQELAARLRRRIDANADGADMMLRYWDSRILLALHRALDDPARQQLFAFGEQALVSDRQGGCLALGLNCPPADPEHAAGVVLSRQDVLALGKATRLDAMLGTVRQRTPAALDAIAPGARYPLAASQLHECLQRGLDSPRDHALALSLALEHGAHWWADETWAPVLEQARESTLLKAYRHHLEPA